MMSDDPILCYFSAIRTEILELKQRIIRIMAGGVTGIPILIGVGRTVNLDILIIVSPIIPVVFTLMLLFEQASLMRAGRYIRLHLEPKMLTDKTLGWESFLETEHFNRYAEKIFAVSCHGTFALYYVVCSFLSYNQMKVIAGDFSASIIASAFAGAFLVILYFVVSMFPIGTKRSHEQR